VGVGLGREKFMPNIGTLLFCRIFNMRLMKLKSAVKNISINFYIFINTHPQISISKNQKFTSYNFKSLISKNINLENENPKSIFHFL